MNTSINELIFNQFPSLTSERLQLRPFMATDAAAYLTLRSHPDVMRYMDTAPFESVAVAQQKIEEIHDSFQQKKGVNWVIARKGNEAMMGYCGIWRIDKHNCRGEIGYALHPDYWNQGFMTEALKSMIDFGFDQLHLHSLAANINPKNKASEQVLCRLGFRKEAHFRENYRYNGRYIDSVIYCLLASDRELS